MYINNHPRALHPAVLVAELLGRGLELVAVKRPGRAVGAEAEVLRRRRDYVVLAVDVVELDLAGRSVFLMRGQERREVRGVDDGRAVGQGLFLCNAPRRRAVLEVRV